MNDLFAQSEPASAEAEKSAIISPCGHYRYELWRRWDVDSLTGCGDDLPNGHKFVMFIGLNPSTADATKDDPTIRKCIGFAKRWGYGALCMTNLFAWRETDPKKMMREKEPVGIENLTHLLNNAENAGIVIAAWGKDGDHFSQDMVVNSLMHLNNIRLHALRLNGDGSPGHPLYIPYTAQPVPWTL